MSKSMTRLPKGPRFCRHPCQAWGLDSTEHPPDVWVSIYPGASRIWIVPQFLHVPCERVPTGFCSEIVTELAEHIDELRRYASTATAASRRDYWPHVRPPLLALRSSAVLRRGLWLLGDIRGGI